MILTFWNHTLHYLLFSGRCYPSASLMAYSNSHFADAYYGELQDLELIATSPNERTQFIDIAWLTSTQNWPDHAVEILRNFMNQHDFQNFRKTCHHKRKLLEAVTAELRRLFDPLQWVSEEHDRLLQKKIKNKIHRIRGEVKHGDLEKALDKLQNIDEALKLIFARLHPDMSSDTVKVAAWVSRCHQAIQ